MTTLDPQAATAAYLAGLPAALRLAAAARTDYGHWAWAISGAVSVAAAWIVLRTGVLDRLQARIDRGGPKPWLAAAACIAAFMLLTSAIAAPWELFNTWRGDQLIHAPARGLAAYASERVNRDLYAVILTVIGASLLYATMRWSPRRWWIWGAAAALGLSLSVVWLPYALASGPAGLPTAPQGPVREGLLRLVHDAGLPAQEIYVSPGDGLKADVTGAPGRARVVVSQGLLARASVAETRAAVGHLAGHYAHGDQLTLALVAAALVAGGLLAMHALFAPVARLLGAPHPDDPSNPAGLPVLAVIAVGWLALATPAMNTFIRLINVRADQYSLEYAREPDGLARSLVRDNGYSKPDPSPVEQAIFYDHPSLRSRVLHAMTWKAAHPS